MMNTFKTRKSVIEKWKKRLAPKLIVPKIVFEELDYSQQDFELYRKECERSEKKMVK